MANPVPFPMGNADADFSDIIIDSAVAYASGSPISITRNALSFDPQETWENYDYPGKRMPVAGLDEVVRSRPVVKGTMMMTGEPQFTVYRPGGTWADAATAGGIITTGVRSFTPGDFRTALSIGDYLQDFFVVWKRQRGDYIGVEFDLAMCTKWNLDAKDGDEGLISVEFEARQTNNGPPYRVVTIPADFSVPDSGGSSGEDSSGDGLPIGGDFGNIIFQIDAKYLRDTVGVSDGASVSTWLQNTGSAGGTGSGGTTTAPVFDIDGGGTGFPSVNYNGSTSSNRYSLPASDGYTAYIVLSHLSAGLTNNCYPWVAQIHSNQSGAGVPCESIAVRLDGKVNYGGSSSFAVCSSSHTSTATIAGTAGKILGHYRDGGTFGLYVNGTLDSADTTMSGSAMGSSTMYVGTVPGVGTPGQFRLHEIVWYDQPHDPTAASAVSAALATKWGL